MDPKNNFKKNISIVAGVFVIAAVALITLFSGKKPDTTTTPVDQTTPTTTMTTPADDSSSGTTPAVSQVPPADTTKQTASVYKDGTYSATGSYMSPGGEDQLGVTVTLKNDIIVAVSVTPGANDHMSARYQSKFISGYKSYVVGKNIADVNLSVVSGSSLTPQGFNDALAQIKTQAQA